MYKVKESLEYALKLLTEQAEKGLYPSSALTKNGEYGFSPIVNAIKYLEGEKIEAVTPYPNVQASGKIKVHNDIQQQQVLKTLTDMGYQMLPFSEVELWSIYWDNRKIIDTCAFDGRYAEWDVREHQLTDFGIEQEPKPLTFGFQKYDPVYSRSEDVIGRVETIREDELSVRVYDESIQTGSYLIWFGHGSALEISDLRKLDGTTATALKFSRKNPEQ